MKDGFSPIELSEGNVQAIFNRCPASDETPIADRTASILFYDWTKPLDQQDTMPFSKSALDKNLKNIRYLFGQLEIMRTHKENPIIIIPKDIQRRYDGELWTGGRATVVRLLYLGNMSSLLGNFDVPKPKPTTALFKVAPTLSPNDPNFPEWWEKHKSEWEDKSPDLDEK